MSLPPPDELHALLVDAVRAGDAEAMGALVRAGTDLERADARGFTPLMYAAYNGHPDVVRLLLAAGARADAPGDPRGNTALNGVAFKGDLPVAEALLAGGAGADAANGSGQTPLMTAAMFRRHDMARLLLAHGADPARADAAGTTARLIARGQDDAAMLALLEPDAHSA